MPHSSIVSIPMSAIAAFAVLVGCSKTSSESARAEERKPSDLGSASKGAVEIELPYAESHDNGSVHWNVDGDGKARVAVKTPAGEPDNDATGTVTFKTPTGEVTAVLKPDADTHTLVAQGPKLTADMTEVKYMVLAGGKPIMGIFHVSPEGTAGLVAEAKTAAKIDIPAGKKGPNGGILQVVGDDVVEIVADKNSGQLRVYVLDADFKVVPIGERKVTLGIVGPTSETVVLTDGPGGAYFVGKISAKVNPIKITVGVHHRGRARVVLVGYRPGITVVVGAAAPPIVVLVTVPWVVVTTPVIVQPRIYWGHGHHWGHGH